MKKTFFLVLLAFAFCFLQAKEPVPNVLFIAVDDLNDWVNCMGGRKGVHTPNLDRMAEEGQKWTSFYSAARVCTPSRASLLTGRLPLRSGMTSNRRRVLFPNSAGGLPSDEVTIAESLGDAG